MFIEKKFVSISEKITDNEYYPQAFLDKCLYKL